MKTNLYNCIKPMTDDPSSPSKKLVRETVTKNSILMSCILARVFSHARNLFRVGHSSIPSKFLVRVSRTSFLDGELGSSVMGFSNSMCNTSSNTSCLKCVSVWLITTSDYVCSLFYHVLVWSNGQRTLLACHRSRVKILSFFLFLCEGGVN